MRGVSGSANRIILFTRYPEPGQVKTRLIPALGADDAALLHRRLTEHTLREAHRQRAAAIEVAWTGGDEPAMRAWLGLEVRLREQVTGDLGARMSAALRAAFDDGVRTALVAGCDCPDLGPETYEAALEALADHDLVLGPAADGGYYLMGMRAAAAPALPALFTHMEWSTSQVLAHTIARARTAGLRIAQLATLEDVDLPDDLGVWKRCSGEIQRPNLSVIVCALNDASRIGDTLLALGRSDDIQVIVVDGGSDDDTRTLAAQLGAIVIQAPSGRAAQFNLGAAKASGDVFLFLHADTRVPPRFRENVRACLAQPNVAAGAFRFATDFDSPAMRIVTASANVRARHFQLPYGDQGLFLRRETFRRAGGFPPVPLMEDYMLVRRLRKLGRIAITESVAVTSGDRWRTLGVWRTTLRNARMVAQYELLRTTPERLADLYRRGPE